MAMGRPTVMTDEVLRKLEEAFLLGCSDIEACFYANIGQQTLYDYQKNNPDFTERKAQLKANPVFIARKSVVDGLKESPDLSLRFLERKEKNEFGLKQTIAGDPDAPLAYKVSVELV